MSVEALDKIERIQKHQRKHAKSRKNNRTQKLKDCTYRKENKKIAVKKAIEKYVEETEEELAEYRAFYADVMGDEDIFDFMIWEDLADMEFSMRDDLHFGSEEF
jgi:hypothetical protein